MMWYNKFNLKTREGNIDCPVCKNKNEEQIFYTLDKLACSNCSSNNIFIRTKNYIYVFAIDQAPGLFRIMCEELKTKTLKDAYLELLETTEVFAGEFK